MRAFGITAVLCGLVLQLAGTAHAQTPAGGADGQAAPDQATPPAGGAEPVPTMASDEMAKQHFEQGRSAYDAGNYQEALDAFQEAYRLSARPELLFNVGQAADRLRMDELALSSFRQYIEARPDAANREQVENRVRALEQVIADREQAEQESGAAPGTPAPVAATEPEPATASDDGAGVPSAGVPLGPLLLGGAGVLVIGGGLVVGAMAKSDEDDYAQLRVQSAQDAATARAQVEDAEDKALIANVLMAAGGAVVVGSVVWLLLELDDDEQPVALSPAFGPGHAGLALRGHLGGSPGGRP